MTKGTALSASLVAALALTPVSRAEADVIDFVAGAIVGTVIDQARRSAQQPQQIHRSTKTVTEVPKSAQAAARDSVKTASRPGIPATDEGRQIQAALNYFGFDAGPVDGQLGERSKTAVSQYQAYLGYPETGTLSDFEKKLLMNSHQRAEAGGSVETDEDTQITRDEGGPRAVIEDVRVELTDDAVIPMPQTEGAPQDAAGAELPSLLMASLVPPASPGAASAPGGDAPGGTLVSLFDGATRTTSSLASQCSDVSLLTGTNGFTTLSSLGDPRSALAEQLCLARTYAIRKGENLTEGLVASPDEIASHCRVYGRELQPLVASLETSGRDAVLEDARDFAAGTSIPSAELAATATVCLSVGYRTDDMDVALGSALVLAAVGEPAYAELVGHHLALGFGTTNRPENAAAWYDMGLAAADAGDAVFAPGQPERTALIRKASADLTGRSADSLAVPQDAALPVLELDR